MLVPWKSVRKWHFRVPKCKNLQTPIGFTPPVLCQRAMQFAWCMPSVCCSNATCFTGLFPGYQNWFGYIPVCTLLHDSTSFLRECYRCVHMAINSLDKIYLVCIWHKELNLNYIIFPFSWLKVCWSVQLWCASSQRNGKSWSSNSYGATHDAMLDMNRRYFIIQPRV